MRKPLSIMVVDTETPGLPPNDLVYDVGIVITDKKGRVHATYNALVEEVFTNPEHMMGAFYAKKLFSHYAGMLARREVTIKPWSQICSEVQQLATEYQVDVIAAYNLRFDQGALRRTNQVLGGTGLLPKRKYKLLDIWWFACITKLKQGNYKALAREMGWVSEKGNLRSNAEVTFKYITRDLKFEEDHTGLSDALIETRILAECFRMKKKIPYGQPIRDPWRLIQA